PTLEKLRRAIREHRTVEMNYQSSQVPHPTQRRLDPYALVHRWGWWYAVGFCHMHREVRTFRADRISEITLLETTFASPPDFDLRAHLRNESQSQTMISARLRFEPESAHIVAGNHSYWESIETKSDGSVEVAFPAPTLEWAASTTLAYGPAVEVVSPPELRVMVADWLKATARKYER
ncbi:MAG: WYL domain-containing protein, partial [Anaerolineales bacterium]|nr:WYL domain-containing protein [Anaerolineales bacterium]